MKNNKLFVLGIFLAFNAFKAQATLFDRGSGLIYDDFLNVTWFQDANLLGTLENTNGYDSTVNAILDANNGVIDVRPNSYIGVNENGTYPLLSNYFGNNGIMQWGAAKGFINYLNIIEYKGYNNWRLPTRFPTASSNISYKIADITSELGYMYFANLNNISSCTPSEYLCNLSSTQAVWSASNNVSFLDSVNENTVKSFNNLNLAQPYFWSDIETSPESGLAWYFGIHTGQQDITNKGFKMNAWILRDGDVATTTVPSPSALLLICSSLLSFICFKLRNIA
ncbi:MAG: hypothetical protein CTY13_02615 [Methylobacter sp.]|nr:MAG: hypothetical protein CTY13_02615 [Methylobacter sp.]